MMRDLIRGTRTMAVVHVTRQEFLKDRQGKRLSDVLNDPEQPFDALLDFFNREEPQRRMEDSETYDKKAPVAAVVRDLEALPDVQTFLSAGDPQRKKRFEQTVAVVVRMIMERLGWELVPKKTAKR